MDRMTTDSFVLPTLVLPTGSARELLEGVLGSGPGGPSYHGVPWLVMIRGKVLPILTDRGTTHAGSHTVAQRRWESRNAELTRY
jgi:hypothetical protein